MVIARVQAATFTVTTTTDGGAGSLRQAIINANATATPDTIVFNIPGTAVQTIFATNGMPSITAPLTIDGYTQPGSSANTLTTGINAVLRVRLDGINSSFGVGIQIFATNCLVRGLIITRFPFYGIDIRGRTNIVEGNFLGTDSTGVSALGNSSYGAVVFSGTGNLIGGATPAARNLISGNNDDGVRLFNAVGNRVEGNFIGINISGTGPLGNKGRGVSVSGGGLNIIGGASAARNVISGNSGAGVSLDNGSEQTSANNTVRGNYIGLDQNGINALPNDTGVVISGAFNNIVTGNVISGNRTAGVWIDSASGDNIVLNLIGVDVSGNARGNGVGVDFTDFGINTVTASNVIAFNTGPGVRLQHDAALIPAFGHRISANSIYSNGGLGIDLNANGVTPNDAGDGDTGANGLQNFPILSNAVTTGSAITIGGSLNSRASANYRLEFFFSPQCDSSGFGEGMNFIGAQNVTTTTAGSANFNFTFSASVPIGAAVTATATDSTNSTSEFSACVAAQMPPTITSQPSNQTVTNGGTANFSVGATGTTPLSYQWRFNGTNISGATSSNLTIANASPSSAGNYTVVITNVAGSIISAVATLTVLVPPGITVQPTSQTVTSGATVTFSVTATGTAPLSYLWRFPGGSLVTGPSLTFNNAGPANEGSYSVVVSNSAGSVTSSVATLTVLVPPAITTQPSSQTVVSGGTATFSVAANGNPTPTYQWRFNGSNLPGQTAASLSINNVAPTNQGNYTVVVANSVGSVTSAVATLTVLVPPTITTQPVGQTVASGGNATFNVTASGTAPLSYQWRFNGSNLPNQTNASVTIINASSASQGNYTVVVANSVGSVTSAVATLTIVTSPTITVQPQSQTVFNGGTTTFSVMAAGSAPLNYQWRFNGANLPGETGMALTINNVSSSNEGNYTVVVANGLGSVTSIVATLTVVVPATITSQPQSQTVFSGSAATFNVTAAGTAPLTYQWRFNGANLPGETGLGLTINNATPANQGNYTVVVANSAGSVTSVVATLTVLVTPVITTQPANQTVISGNSATFTVVATGAASYQWRFNGSNLPGETGSSLTIGSATPANEGGYSVVVANSAGSVTSVVATLTVLVTPVITTQPASRTIASGGSVTFNVVATGTAPLSYQWRFNGANLPGKTGSSLTINNATPANQGGYTVLISNGAGTVTSAEAFLTVLLLPDLKLSVLVSPSTPSVQTIVTYNITVFGTIPTTVTALRLTNELPANASFNGATPDRGACTFFNGVVVCDFGNIDQSALPLNVSIEVFPQVAEVMVDRTSVGGTEADADPSDNVAVTFTTVLPPTPPIIVVPPSDQTVPPGEFVVLQVVAVPSPLRYQWQRNGVNLPGETSDILVLPNVSAADGGGYSVGVENDYGAVNSRQATVRINSPPLPFSDDFANAGLLTDASGFGSGSNVGATRQLGEPLHAGKRGGSSVWINWLAPAAGIVTFSTDGSTFDTVLAAYAGQTVANLGEVASDDDGGNFNNSRIAFRVNPGTIYHIAIDGFARGQGSIVLTWQLEATVDPRPFIFLQPTNQIVRSGDRVEFTVGGGVDPAGEMLQYQWFFEGQPINGANQDTLIIPAAALENVGRYFVRLTVNNRFLDSRSVFLQLIQGAATDAGLASSKFADVVEDATGGEPILGPVAAKSPRTKAVAKGFTATQIFSTLGSTKEPGEPNHCGVIGGASYWFAYQAPAHGSLIMNTDGSLFDTVLAIYTGPGDDFATLVPLACDNNSGADGLDSKTRFSVSTGTIYWIAVDGVGGTSGKVTLNWNFFPEMRAPTNTASGFRFTVAGKTNVNFTIQGSTDLINWQPLLTTNSATGLYNFTDTNRSFSYRFYRTLHDL